MRNLRRSPGSGRVFDELSGAVSDPVEFQRAVSVIAQSDPLVKLLQQVMLGRMKPQDTGLRAVTEAWLATYQKVLESSRFDERTVRRLDPSPRIDVLVAAGILAADHPGATGLRECFAAALARATP